MTFFTSDLHLGHKAITKYRTKFETMEEHDDYIIEKILSLGKKDLLIVIGDFLFDGPHYDEYVKKLSEKKCRIKLVMGNHDSIKLYDELNNFIEMQLPIFSYKNKWISHCPIHPQEMRNRDGNIHGHLHGDVVRKSHHDYINEIELVSQDERYFNVNLDNNNFEFVPVEKINEHFNKIK